MHQSIMDSITSWCNRTTIVLTNWEEWASEFSVASIGASASTLDGLTERGQLLTTDLMALVRERQLMLAQESISSFRELLVKYPSPSNLLIEKFTLIEALAAQVRKTCVAQWISIRQASTFVDDMLFMFKSGQTAPATYSNDEQEAFQGGYLLDSEA